MSCASDNLGYVLWAHEVVIAADTFVKNLDNLRTTEMEAARTAAVVVNGLHSLDDLLTDSESEDSAGGEARLQKTWASSCWKRRTRVRPASAPLNSLRCSTPKSASRSGSSRYERARCPNIRQCPAHAEPLGRAVACNCMELPESRMLLPFYLQTARPVQACHEGACSSNACLACIQEDALCSTAVG
jgi:hypothetical protein